MPIILQSEEELVTAAIATRRPVAFLVGSPLSLNDGLGVPGVAEMLTFVRCVIQDLVSFALPRFEAALTGKSGADAYQEGMRWMGVNAGQDAVNAVIKKAVLQARKTDAPATFERDGQPSEWHIPSGTSGLGELVARGGEKFLGPILTTNFDPLLSLAVRRAGGQSGRRVLTTDGTLAGSVEDETCNIVHLHGFWRDSDTLHTQAQLTNPRPKLKASLQRLLQQRTLIVVAYGGWDDVFTAALVELMNDEQAPLDVAWCFHEDDPLEVEKRYGKLLSTVAPAIVRNRFRSFGGIDCHRVFASILSTLRRVSPAAVTAAARSPLAGWEEINAAYLNAMPTLSEDEIVRYFDGAIPTWRHAISAAIPRRQAVAEVTSRLATLHSGKGGCSIQLIRAAGGEGKTTVLLQIACDAARCGVWTVLWRPSPHVRLPLEHVTSLDTGKQWLVVADDAENLVQELCECARLLHDAGRSNVHFLLAARDADWWAKFGDKPPWETWIQAWVRRNRAIMLRGISRVDAEAVVEAWSRCGARGLRELANFASKDEQAIALVKQVREAVYEQHLQMEKRNNVEGSFFGGLLAVRFGQNGLQAHVQEFLNRLREDLIQGSSHTLFDALVYVAACHAVGIPGLEANVLADLVAVPRDWVQSFVVRPLGEEASAVEGAGHVFTRHSKVAAAVLLEADQTLDLAELWTTLVRQTVRTSRDVHIGSTFGMIVYAAPRLLEGLPKQFSDERRKEIAFAAGRAAVAHQPEWLGCIISLGKTYRLAGSPTDAVRLFRDNLATLHSKRDFNDHIRGYWHEWGVSEGSLGDEPAHRAADAWLQGISLSDHFRSAPITEENVTFICAGLGVAFGKLAQHGERCPFALGRRAVSYLGRAATLDPLALGYFERYDREADKIGTPQPKDIEGAIRWLETAVAQAGRELQDPFLQTLLRPEQVSFSRLAQFFTYAKPVSVETLQSDVEQRRQVGSGDLIYEVWRVIKDLVDTSISEQRQLYLPAVGFALADSFPETKPVHEELGFATLNDLVLSFGDFAIVGEHPRSLVRYRDAGQSPIEGNLRYEVWTVISDLVDKSISQQRLLYLPTVGSELSRRFPGSIPAHRNLGFETLADLIRSFDEFAVTGEHPKWRVEYRNEQEVPAAGVLRDRVGVIIRRLIDTSKAEQRALYLPVVGLELTRSFPEARPVHNNLGFATLTDLINSFDEFQVTGGHPQWFVEYRPAPPATSVTDRRSEVQTVIGEMIERSTLEQRPLYLPTVGFVLAQRFPEAKPIQHSLGFETLTGLIQSYDEFAVTGEHPRWVVQYRGGATSPPITPE